MDLIKDNQSFESISGEQHIYELCFPEVDISFKEQFIEQNNESVQEVVELQTNQYIDECLQELNSNVNQIEDQLTQNIIEDEDYDQQVLDSIVAQEGQQQEQQLIAAEEESDEFVVEAIVGKRRRKGKIEYQLKWKGYEDKDNSWEPMENLNCRVCYGMLCSLMSCFHSIVIV